MLPLTGVKVIELAYNVAGPYAGFILAMLGADVLKIERPEGGDDARGWGPPFWKGTSSTFQALNINKRAITLDLKDAGHIEWLKGMIKDTDVVVQNLRPGVLEGLVRYSYIDSDGRGVNISDGIRSAPGGGTMNTLSEWFIGGNWYLKGNDYKLQFGYIHGQSKDTVTGGAAKATSDGVRTQVQVNF